MFRMNISDIKVVLQECIIAAKEDEELKTLLAELIQTVLAKNTASKPTETYTLINPITVAANEGIGRLVEELEKMEGHDLISVIKEYGLDPTKKSYRWKTKEKLVSLIKEKISALLTRGDVFSDSR